MYQREQEADRSLQFIFGGAALALVLITLGLGLGWFVALQNQPETVIVIPTRIPPTVIVIPTLTPTATPAVTVTLTAPSADGALFASPTIPPEPTATLEPLAPEEIVLFRAQQDQIPAYPYPDATMNPIGLIPLEQELLAAGRTADGAWWLLCCLADQPVWVQLTAENLRLERGDVGTVDVIER